MPKQSEAVFYGDPRCSAYPGFYVPKRNLAIILDSRKRSGVTRSGLAAQCGIDDASYVSKWIKGKRYMTDKNVARVSRILNVSPLCLLDLWPVHNPADHTQLWGNDESLESDYESWRKNLGLLCKYGKGSYVTYTTLSVDDGPSAISSVGAIRLPNDFHLSSSVQPPSKYMLNCDLASVSEELRDYYRGSATRTAWDDTNQTLAVMTYEEELRRHNEPLIRAYTADLRDLRHLMEAVISDAKESASSLSINRIIEAVAHNY